MKIFKLCLKTTLKRLYFQYKGQGEAYVFPSTFPIPDSKQEYLLVPMKIDSKFFFKKSMILKPKGFRNCKKKECEYGVM